MRFRLRIDQERCKGCGLCVSACQKAALRMAKSLNAKGAQYSEVASHDACVGCLRCADLCPEGAIEIDRLPDSDTAKAEPGPARTAAADARSAETEDS